MHETYPSTRGQGLAHSHVSQKLASHCPTRPDEALPPPVPQENEPRRLRRSRPVTLARIWTRGAKQ